MSHLHRFVEDAAANLDHLQVLLLFVPGALDVGHPAALVLLAGIDEVAHRSILVEDLTETHRRTGLELGSTRDGEDTKQRTGRCLWDSRLWAHLPHKVIILQQIHMLRGQDSPGERPHLCSCFDPSLGKDAKSFSWDRALGDDHLTGQHQAGQLLHLCRFKKKKKRQKKRK